MVFQLAFASLHLVGARHGWDIEEKLEISGSKGSEREGYSKAVTVFGLSPLSGDPSVTGLGNTEADCKSHRLNGETEGEMDGEMRGSPFLGKAAFPWQLTRHTVMPEAIWMMDNTTYSDSKPQSLIGHFSSNLEVGLNQFSCLIPASCQAFAVSVFKKKKKKNLGPSFENFKNTVFN